MPIISWRAFFGARPKTDIGNPQSKTLLLQVTFSIISKEWSQITSDKNILSEFTNFNVELDKVSIQNACPP